MDQVAPEVLAALRVGRAPDDVRTVVRLREVDDRTVEVYETDGPVETATVLRRSPAGWRVESEAPAVPDRPVLHLLLPTPPDAVNIGLTRYDFHFRATFDRPGGAERNPDGSITVRGRDTTVTVRVEPAGPVGFVPQQTAYLREFYDPGDTDESGDEEYLATSCAAVRSAIVLTAPPPTDGYPGGEAYALILQDIAKTAEVLLRQLPATAVVVPGGGSRRLTARRFTILNLPTNENEYLCFAIWCLVRQVGDHLITEGRRLFGMPEMELPVGAATGAELALAAMGEIYSGPRPGRTTGPGRVNDWTVRPGRLGPEPGTSYGRWGSVAVHPADPPAAA